MDDISKKLNNYGEYLLYITLLIIYPSGKKVSTLIIGFYTKVQLV